MKKIVKISTPGYFLRTTGITHFPLLIGNILFLSKKQALLNDISGLGIEGVTSSVPTDKEIKIFKTYTKLERL